MRVMTLAAAAPRVFLVANLVLWPAACSDHPQLTAAAQARLTAHLEPARWQDLDPSHPGSRLRDPRTQVVFVHIPATPPFLLAETELSVAQWQLFVREFAGPDNVPMPNDDQLPAPLSLPDAELFCARFGYRLPSESEWETACRAGTNAWWEPAALPDFAWFHRNAGDAPHRVATRQPNPHGLFDMLGNVWEWCAGDAATEGALRGGSWFTNPAPIPELRTQAAKTERNSFYGFRPARSLAN